MCLYTTGTWCWVFFIVWLFAAVANKKFNKTAYKYITGSAMYAYLSHYFFIIVIAVTIIRPYQISFIPALFIEIFLTYLIILITYACFVLMWEFIFPPKEEEEVVKSEEE